MNFSPFSLDPYKEKFHDEAEIHVSFTMMATIESIGVSQSGPWKTLISAPRIGFAKPCGDK